MEDYEFKTIRAFGICKESIVDGPGIRLALFMQGCPHKCRGCHNPDSHDPSGGWDCNPQAVLEAVKRDPLLKGITFSGGEPFMQAEALIPLAKAVKDIGRDVVCYTGFTIEELVERNDPFETELLQNIDILIDGPFEIEKRDLTLIFRGSSNQRVLDVKKTLQQKEPVYLEEYEQ